MEFSRLVKTRRTDGVIITGLFRSDPRLETLIHEDVPCVLAYMKAKWASEWHAWISITGGQDITRENFCFPSDID